METRQSQNTKEQTQITDFELRGLGRPKSATCEPFGKEGFYFWPKVELTQDRFDALWNYMEGHWGEKKMIAEIEHEGINEDLMPINGKLINVREA